MKFKTLLLLVIIISVSCKKQESNSALVAHWSLDVNANDLSYYQSHGVIFGDPVYVNSVIEGKALDFNGDDFIEITVDGETPAQIRDLSTGSISLWFKAREWNIDTTILPILYYGRDEVCPDAYDATNGGLIIEVGHGGIFPSENVFFTVYDEECEYPTMCFDSNDDSGIIEPDKWYHFVVSVGKDYNVGYLNGEELIDRRYNFQSDSTSLFFKDFVSHDKIWIGKGHWKNKEVYFDGLIDDIRIYNTPLGLEQVKELYNSQI
ncbi:MAG: LamG domain-containing protein [Flavobacteriales bacterium]|nr:LamG domain-containing protein [Flavobacteriales bacterium]